MDTYDKARRDVIIVGKFTLKWGAVAAALLIVWWVVGNMMGL